MVPSGAMATCALPETASFDPESTRAWPVNPVVPPVLVPPVLVPPALVPPALVPPALVPPALVPPPLVPPVPLLAPVPLPAPVPATGESLLPSDPHPQTTAAESRHARFSFRFIDSLLRSRR